VTRWAGVAVRQLTAEQRVYWRNVGAAFFTFLLPILTLVFVGGLARNATVDGEPYATFFVPGMLAMAVVVTAFAGLAITLVIRRESGILKRIRGTPLPPALYLGALIGSITLVLALEVVLVLVLGSVAFDVPAPVHGPLLVVLCALGAACFAPLGVALSPFVRSAEGSSAVVNAVYLPMLFLSGAFFPLDRLPTGVQDVARALPLTQLLEALRAAFTGGSGLHDLAGLGVLLGWGVVGAAVAVRCFSWEPRGQ
jgi:ABC-2 type transport system permease protein